MHHRAESRFFRLVANGVELILRERRLAALADTAGGEDFDDVGTVFGMLLHYGAQFLGSACGVSFAGDGLKRSEDSRARQAIASYCVTEFFVEGRAEALHGGEAGGEHLPIVRGACENGHLL